MIDDDERLQNVVREFLENHGFAVSTLPSGRGLEDALAEIKPDLLLLDVMLPGDDGFTILRALRASSRIPVIMLTACGDETDRIVGLEIGADDYLGKPFNPRELLARIKAVMRRVNEPVGNPETPSEDGVLHVGSYTLDEKRQRISRTQAAIAAREDRPEAAPQGLFPLGEALRESRAEMEQGGLCPPQRFAKDDIDLSHTEFRILHAFMSHPGEVLSRDKVLALVFGDDHYVCDRNIDVYISRIRGILRKLGETEQRIRTVWGSGYSWVREA
ncbi:response regulator transcription factor [Desulfovibrio sp. OttesenSCG-928-O18]|nr:response regulator transcription factor [Desulfovibrio sp. OttesenSCG-928-O18]